MARDRNATRDCSHLGVIKETADVLSDSGNRYDGIIKFNVRHRKFIRDVVHTLQSLHLLSITF